MIASSVFVCVQLTLKGRDFGWRFLAKGSTELHDLQAEGSSGKGLSFGIWVIENR